MSVGLHINEAESGVLKDLPWKCRASWPCVAACKRDFGKCPMGCREADAEDAVIAAPMQGWRDASRGLTGHMQAACFHF